MVREIRKNGEKSYACEICKLLYKEGMGRKMPRFLRKMQRLLSTDHESRDQRGGKVNFGIVLLSSPS